LQNKTRSISRLAAGTKAAIGSGHDVQTIRIAVMITCAGPIPAEGDQ
jgi:hypothetical protein